MSGVPAPFKPLATGVRRRKRMSEETKAKMRASAQKRWAKKKAKV